MSRAESCVEGYHMHVGQCQRAGYANGWADAMERVTAWADEWEASYGGVDPLPERWRDLLGGAS